MTTNLSLKHMPNNPRTAGIAFAMRRYYAEHKRVSYTGFQQACSSVLSPKEAEEIFEYMTCIKICLKPSTKRMYTWTCNQDHFNDIAVGEMLDFINLREKKDERHKKPTDKVDESKPIIKTPNLYSASLDELVQAIEHRGWEVTLKHIRPYGSQY